MAAFHLIIYGRFWVITEALGKAAIAAAHKGNMPIRVLTCPNVGMPESRDQGNFPTSFNVSWFIVSSSPRTNRVAIAL
jgi:hypothetical protein